MLLLLGQLIHWIDVVPADFLLVLKCAVKWVSLLYPAVPALWYCTGVSLEVGHIDFLCNEHSGIFALVLFFCVF